MNCKLLKKVVARAREKNCDATRILVNTISNGSGPVLTSAFFESERNDDGRKVERKIEGQGQFQEG